MYKWSYATIQAIIGSKQLERFSEDQLKSIRKWFALGMPVSEIAERINTTTNKIYTVVKTSKVEIWQAMPRSASPIVETSVALVQDANILINLNCYSDGEIAEKLNVDVNRITRIRNGDYKIRKEICPRCGRYSEPPCLACKLRHYPKRSFIDDSTAILTPQLNPEENERYLKIKLMKEKGFSEAQILEAISNQNM
jgi:hypothetical protein